MNKQFDLQALSCEKFLLNSDHLILLNITPDEVTETYKRLAAGIANLDPNSNDEVDQTAYLDGDGHKTTTVTGGQYTQAFTGHRKYGDEAQDFIFDQQLSFGCSRETDAQVFRPDGTSIIGPVTIANITGPGGDSGAKGDVAFELHFNGKPAYTPVTAAADLAAVIAAGVTSGTTTATKAVTPPNKLVYKLTDAQLTSPNLNTKFEGIAYTSGDEIAATAGQWLLVVEVTEYDRVVAVTNHELQAGDIAV